jgi:hypothetical protein
MIRDRAGAKAPALFVRSRRFQIRRNRRARVTFFCREVPAARAVIAKFGCDVLPALPVPRGPDGALPGLVVIPPIDSETRCPKTNAGSTSSCLARHWKCQDQSQKYPIYPNVSRLSLGETSACQHWTSVRCINIHSCLWRSLDPSSGAWCGVNFIAATRLMMTNAMPVPR